MTTSFALIVLDCDGVILESVAVKTEAFKQLVLHHGKEAADRMVAFHQAHGGVSRYEKFAWFYRHVLGEDLTPAQQAFLNEKFTNLCLLGVLNAPFVNGIEAFLRDWHEKIPLFVASGTPDNELQEIFQKRNLSRFFRGVYGTPPDKTELLKNIVELAGVPPARVLMVGDSTTDLDAALSVGTRFYGRGLNSAREGDGWGEDMTALTEYVLRYQYPNKPTPNR